MTLDDCKMTDDDFDKKMQKDKRTMWTIVRQEGSMMATDYWCLRYINLPVPVRYNLLFHILRWWGSSSIGRWLTWKKTT